MIKQRNGSGTPKEYPTTNKKMVESPTEKWTKTMKRKKIIHPKMKYKWPLDIGINVPPHQRPGKCK